MASLRRRGCPVCMPPKRTVRETIASTPEKKRQKAAAVPKLGTPAHPHFETHAALVVWSVWHLTALSPTGACVGDVASLCCANVGRTSIENFNQEFKLKTFLTQSLVQDGTLVKVKGSSMRYRLSARPEEEPALQ